MKTTLYIGIAISMLLYITSLFIPAAVFVTPIPNQSESMIGIEILLGGWAAVLKGNLAWLANVAVVLSWLAAAAKRPFSCAALSACAVLFTIDVIRFDSAGVPDQSASCCMAIKVLESGFYVWSLSAIVMLFMAAVAIALRPDASNSSLHSDPQAGR